MNWPSLRLSGGLDMIVEVLLRTFAEGRHTWRIGSAAKCEEFHVRIAMALGLRRWSDVDCRPSVNMTQRRLF
jgi:hypothetical protein